MNNITIYHNPRCSKSRQALAMLEAYNPTVIEYLKTPLDNHQISEILRKLKVEPRQAMRRNESIYKELNLDDESFDQNLLIEAIVKHPILLQRPIVILGEHAIIARPAEKLKEIL